MSFPLNNSDVRALYLWSIIAVFSELAVVRMFTTMVSGMSYYGNCFYVAAIFFLGCGFMARNVGRHRALVPSLLLVACATVWWLSHYNMLQTLNGEFQWHSFANVTPKMVDFSLPLAVLLLVLVMALPMTIIGATQAEAFTRVEGIGCYLVAAFGGISGAVLFLVQNQFAPNIGWMLAIWLSLFFLSGWKGLWQRLLLGVVPFVLISLLFQGFILYNIWSPYQRLYVAEVEPAIHYIYTNDMYITNLMALPVGERTSPHAEMYYTLFNDLKQNGQVLVLGSGTGTKDVAVALHRGAGHVVAVEIDPMIIDISKRLDPQRTYQDSRVELINSDARKFVNRETRTFDMVYLLGLDSQTNSSNHSRFRLDSFLYTMEGLAAIWGRVADDGYLVLSFASAVDWIPKRLYSMLQTVTGNRVHTYQSNQFPLTVFVAAKNRMAPSLPASNYTDISEHVKLLPGEAYLPTDDAPFLYNLKRGVTPEHLKLTSWLFILLLSIALGVRWFVKSPEATEASSSLAGSVISAALLFGAAFFFMQLRAVSLLTPVVGSTYLGLSLVVIGTIVFSFTGSLLAVRLKNLDTFVWPLLFVSLAGSIPLTAIFIKGGASGQVAAVLMLFLPFACAGYIYARIINPFQSGQIMKMQMWNMIGGCIGGLLEWCVIYTGFKSAVYVPIGLYLLAMFSIAYFKRRSAVCPPVFEQVDG